MVHAHKRIGYDYEQDVEEKLGIAVWQTVGTVFWAISFPVSGEPLLRFGSCANNEDVVYVSS